MRTGAGFFFFFSFSRRLTNAFLKPLALAREGENVTLLGASASVNRNQIDTDKEEVGTKHFFSFSFFFGADCKKFFSTF